MPLAIYIIRSYMGTVPASIIESAKADGASHFTTFWRLVLPMSVPVLASFAIFQFLWVWNDLLIALIFLGQTNEVVTVNLAQLLGRLGEGWQLLTAGAFITDDAAAHCVLRAAAVLLVDSRRGRSTADPPASRDGRAQLRLWPACSALTQIPRPVRSGLSAG